MSETTTPPRRGARLVAAAAVVSAGVAGGVWATQGDGETSVKPPTVTELALPQPDVMAMCARIEPALVAGAELALRGTAVSVTDEQVVLEVSKWFKGGSSDRVELAAPQDDLGLLEGTITFEQGNDYLVTATDGLVSFCGFSGLATPELAAIYAEAFPG